MGQCPQPGQSATVLLLGLCGGSGVELVALSYSILTLRTEKWLKEKDLYSDRKQLKESYAWRHKMT